MSNINFKKADGLIPAVIQDVRTGKVLMLGYMNREAYDKTVTEGKVCFYSRSRGQLWTKGETSGNYLSVQEILVDCDGDTLLIKVIPAGPVCHTGQDTCFAEKNRKSISFLETLEKVIYDRKESMPEGSYTAMLFKEGVGKTAQKTGEEAVELVIEAVKGDRERILEESADLIYHFLVLLASCNIRLEEVVQVLENRHV